MSTAPEIGNRRNAILTNPQHDALSEVEKRNVYLVKKNYDEQSALPEKLVAEIARQQAITMNTWKKAKKAKTFATLKPELEKLVGLNKQAAQNQPDTEILSVHIPVEKQRKITQALAQALGYDATSTTAGGRIDETEHPFTSGYYDDVRVTTHYYPDNYISAVFSVLHETGHALYEQNLNPNWKYQPLGSSCSFGIHESQSRLYENIIGRSEEFWTHMLPKLKQITAPALTNVSLSQFVLAINKVEPSKIRKI